VGELGNRLTRTLISHLLETPLDTSLAKSSRISGREGMQQAESKLASLLCSSLGTLSS
jgi:hypothetical protein